MEIVNLINRCGIPIEHARPVGLVEITSEYDLISNSDKTKSLRVFEDKSASSNKKVFLEKTFSIDNSSGSDYREILFYSDIRNHIDKIPGLACTKAHALRWGSDSCVTLRLDFVANSVVAEKYEHKENAMEAAGNFANYFYTKPGQWPKWLLRSVGIGSTTPEYSIAKTTELFDVLGLGEHTELLTDFYMMRKVIVELYKKSPMSITHSDANHQNIRFLSGSCETLFLDWPRVRIASVADDAARIIQPWIIFHNKVEDSKSLAKIEESLYNAFSERLEDIPSEKMRFVRAAYEIRTVINAIGLGSHILSWLNSSQSDLSRSTRHKTAKHWYQLILTRIEGLKMIVDKIDDVSEVDRISDLKNRYLGEGATAYNKQRQGNARWQKEHQITRKFLESHKGKSVLDMPIGTGRFLPLYKEFGLSAIGMDRSVDMLTQSQLEAESTGLDDLTLVLGDATNFNSEKLRSDIVVCTRFLNWLPSDLARKTFLNLAKACNQEMLITLSSIDESKFQGDDRKRIEMRLANMHVPKNGDKLPPNGAHSYLQFLEWVKSSDMELVESELLLEGRSNLRVEMHRLRRL